MIALPTTPVPNRMTHELIDFGFVQRGASSLRVLRPGARYRNSFSWPTETMTVDVTPEFTSRIQRSMRDSLRVFLPLTRSQGSPGTTVVNGAGQSGSAISIRGFTPDYVAQRGYWLTIIEADGTPYLHSVYEPATANGSGVATVQIEPPLRAPFADGATVQMAAPYIQGFVVAENFSWSIEERKKTPLTIVVEEFQ